MFTRRTTRQQPSAALTAATARLNLAAAAQYLVLDDDGARVDVEACGWPAADRLAVHKTRTTGRLHTIRPV